MGKRVILYVLLIVLCIVSYYQTEVRLVVQYIVISLEKNIFVIWGLLFGIMSLVGANMNLCASNKKIIMIWNSFLKNAKNDMFVTISLILLYEIVYSVLNILKSNFFICCCLFVNLFILAIMIDLIDEYIELFFEFLKNKCNNY